MLSIIQTATPRLEASVEFYKKLGFTLLSKEKSILGDNQCVIQVNADRFARVGVRLIKSNWKEEVALLKLITAVSATDTGFLLADPSGCWIYLDESPNIPSYEIEDLPSSVLGKYSGISLECLDIHLSVKIWNILGFKKTMGNIEQGWMGLSNEFGFGISMMAANSCPHLFFNPSLTYFNGKTNNPLIIQKLRDLKIEIAEEITTFNDEGLVDNIILRDLGGLGFFIFND